MKSLYLEPFSGISGDMLLGALCGLLDDYKSIKKLPQQLNLPDAGVEVHEVSKNGIVCKHVKVIDLNPQKNNHNHHRHLKEIIEIIDKGSISNQSKNIAREIFSIVGHAESKIHKVPFEKVHFHELSGVDSIIDITGCAVLMDKLKIKRTYSAPICTGYGKVKTRHGILPVPAPATSEILTGMPCYRGDEKGEKVTPTGAAILKYLDPDFEIPAITTRKIAYGPGEKDFKNPNVLRASLIEKVVREDKDQLYIIESNIDDAPAEYLGSDFQSDLVKIGAIDYYFTHVQMKKGRPGIKISVMTSPKNVQKVSDFILEKTSTIGIRYFPVSRNKLPRKTFDLDTKYGKVRVKEVTKPSGNKRFKIEYESLKEISKKNKLDIEWLQSELLQLIHNHRNHER